MLERGLRELGRAPCQLTWMATAIGNTLLGKTESRYVNYGMIEVSVEETV